MTVDKYFIGVAFKILIMLVFCILNTRPFCQKFLVRLLPWEEQQYYLMQYGSF
jgi:hypothetical protein